MKTILVTGGCGFIGSNFIRLLNAQSNYRVVNLDKLTYAGNPENLSGIEQDKYYCFVKGDIGQKSLIDQLLKKERPWAIVNFAAESHVDRSILDASPFLQTNTAGVQTLLEAVREHPVERFLHVSTDEVYGDREGREAASENFALSPSSPYAGTKASADLICFSYRRTYGVPVLITRSSNNYGPYQFPEKLIPLLIRNGLSELELPIYGDGKQIRDWLYVEDNCQAILAVLENGKVGSTYNIGTEQERTNLDVVHAVCAAIAERRGLELSKLQQRIRSVADRPGHDRRYAIDTSKVRAEIGWQPRTDFASGIRRTVDWYVDHPDWIAHVTSGDYRKYYDSVYQQEWGKSRRHVERGKE